MVNSNLAGNLSDIYTNIGQASTILLVNRLTIRRWIKQGKLHSEMIGRTALIPKDDIRRIAQERGIDFGGI